MKLQITSFSSRSFDFASHERTPRWARNPRWISSSDNHLRISRNCNVSALRRKRSYLTSYGCIHLGFEQEQCFTLPLDSNFQP